MTSGTLLLSDGIASIYNVSTPPELRRRGYASAITAYMMEEAIRCGYRLMWIWASDAGKSVYARLGFVEEDFGIREHTWHRNGETAGGGAARLQLANWRCVLRLPYSGRWGFCSIDWDLTQQHYAAIFRRQPAAGCAALPRLGFSPRRSVRMKRQNSRIACWGSLLM